MRIVVADDSVVLRAVLRRFVEEAGHEVVGEVVDGPALLAAVRQLLPDTVILDGRLPPAGAIPAIETLHGIDARCAIYVVAALQETDVVRAAAAAGACGVILRPILASQIAAVLRVHPKQGPAA